MSESKNWIVRQTTDINGVTFQVGDSIPGVISVIDKNTGVTGLWLKSNNKKIAIPQYLLAEEGTPEAEAALKEGKSLLHSIRSLPTHYKVFPVMGLMAGLGFAKYQGGGVGRYAGYGLLFTALTTIPASIWIWKNMNTTMSAVNKGIMNQTVNKERVNHSKEESDAFAGQLANALGELTKVQTGIAPDAGDLRVVTSMLQSSELNKAEFDLLMSYINASVEYTRRDMNAEETEETLKDITDKIKDITEQISKSEKLTAIINKINGK